MTWVIVVGFTAVTGFMAAILYELIRTHNRVVSELKDLKWEVSKITRTPQRVSLGLSADDLHSMMSRARQL